MSINPYADTVRGEQGGGNGPGGGGQSHGSQHGCALAQETHAMLVGDHQREGVFEQLRNLHAMVRVRGNLIVLGVWVIAMCSAWTTWGTR